MKNYIILILTAVAIILLVRVCSHKPTTTTIRTSKIENYRDTIKQIQIQFKTVYKTIAVSGRPDTLIRYILRLDTVKGNLDSFTAVKLVQGLECCAIGVWKDSIIKDDSLQIQSFKVVLKKCEKKNTEFKLWQKLSYFIGVVGGVFYLAK